MAKTSMLSIRVPEDLKQKLQSLATQQGRESCSDLIKEILQSSIDADRPVTERTFIAATDNSLEENRRRAAALLDEMRKLHDRREQFQELVEQNGGQPGWLSQGAPENLLLSLKLIERSIKHVTEEMKTVEHEIQVGLELLDYQQCLQCHRLVPASNYCSSGQCEGVRLPKTNRIWRKHGNWDDDFSEEEFAVSSEPEPA